MAKRTRVIGIQATVFNLQQLSDVTVRNAASKAMERAGQIAKGEVYRNLTRSDHTLKQLANLGHPYAKRHGSIQIHSGEQHVVHQHTGRMAATLEGEVRFKQSTSGVDRPYYLLGWWTNVLPHVRWVVEGTKVMLPRDVLWLTVSAPHVRPALLKEFVKVMGAEMRTQAGIRFGGGGVP